ncbi:MAG: DUF3307 domain-containing protein [Bacteroidetes bacterium]|nr:DUF3307 domain-containing protein [Bacteroidota bacterium]
MTSLLLILLAHIIGDFFLQPYRWVEVKEATKGRSKYLFYHVGIHIVLMLLAVKFFNWIPVLIIGVCHYFIDLSKLSFQKQNTRVQWFVGDQILHITSILVVWYFWHDSLNTWIDGKIPDYWLAYGIGVLFLTRPMSITMGEVLKPFSQNIPGQNDQSLSKAGRYIGMLERVLVFVFITGQHWEAVGFLIAAKSVFRFGDLRESKQRKLTEYILIGTLLSFGTAMAIAMAVESLKSI